MELHGRVEERAFLHRLLDAARDGLSGVLVVRGDAGIGKTALLAATAAAAADLQVARIDGVEAERDLAFAALHRLLRPFLPILDRLPRPQRHALESAFGLVAGAPPDHFLVGLGVLTVLADAATARPVLMVCDDAHWIDQESLGVLAFVARRLQADRIAMVFATRHTDGEDPLYGLPHLQVQGLARDAALALLTATVGRPLDPAAAVRIVADTQGNPLAIRELWAEPSTEQVAEAALQLQPVPLGRRLEERFARQVRELPEQSRMLLLVVAAEPSGSAVLLARAAAHLGGPDRALALEDALHQAEAAGLLVTTPRVAFRHPLIRSAVYGGAAPADRRRAHGALAAATDRDADADRRAWHLAGATLGPDEGVAAELERCAAAAHDRGGYAAQAAFLAKAGSLTPSSHERGQRLLAASAAALQSGSPRRAAELLDLIGDRPGDPLARARSLRLRGLIDLQLRRGDAIADLLAAAAAYRGIDSRSSRDTLLEAFEAAIAVPSLDPEGWTLSVARSALELAVPPGDADPTIADLLLEGHSTLVAVGFRPAVRPLRRAVEAMRVGGPSTAGAGRWFLLNMIAPAELWDDVGWRDCAVRAVEEARADGALHALRTGLYSLAAWETFAGRLRAAESRQAEFEEVSAAIEGRHPRSPGYVDLIAWQGDEERTRAAAGAVITGPTTGISLNIARMSLARLGLASGRYAEALDDLRPVFDEDRPYFTNPVLPDLVEAGVRAGDRALAEESLARLDDRATASGTGWGLGVLARSRALLAVDHDDAERLYQEAIALLAGTTIATDLARAHLLHGEWLRRQRRRMDARDALHTAHDLFAAMGAAGFAARARRELAATGEHARRRTSATAGDLTPQELRIARLAGQRATNQEIATMMFLSASTVEYHLRKVFQKLAVTSRRELAHALPADDDVAAGTSANG